MQSISLLQKFCGRAFLMQLGGLILLGRDVVLLGQRDHVFRAPVVFNVALLASVAVLLPVALPLLRRALWQLGPSPLLRLVGPFWRVATQLRVFPSPGQPASWQLPLRVWRRLLTPPLTSAPSLPQLPRCACATTLVRALRL